MSEEGLNQVGGEQGRECVARAIAVDALIMCVHVEVHGKVGAFISQLCLCQRRIIDCPR
jgi:hypothetical protein